MKNIVFFQEGVTGDVDRKNLVRSAFQGRLYTDSVGRPRVSALATSFTNFDLLPATALAAGKDPLVITLGTGTEVTARSAKGGVNHKTQATTPAKSDNALLVSAAATGLLVPLTVVSQPVFRTRIILTQVSKCVGVAATDTANDATLVTSAMIAFFGLNETQTNVDPTTDAGDGAGFLYAPNPGVAGSPAALTTPTGLAYASVANWIAHMKVAGADTFVDTGIPVIAGIPYDLEVAYDSTMKPLFYINGNLVATGAATGTTGHTLGPVLGVQIQNTTPAGQLDFDAHYLAVERLHG